MTSRPLHLSLGARMPSESKHERQAVTTPPKARHALEAEGAAGLVGGEPSVHTYPTQTKTLAVTF